MSNNVDSLWTIDDLGSQVALALTEDYAGQSNGSVRKIPNRRTIRYYTTIGLIDPPQQMRGRTALYGLRHLLQLVAIKRLQAKGYTLEQVQQHLLGQSDANLKKIARLPAEFTTKKGTTTGAESSSRSESFWREAPLDAGIENDDRDEVTDSESTPVIQGVPINADVTLLLQTIRPIEDDDAEAIRVAAAPLLKILEKRRLLRARRERNTS